MSEAKLGAVGAGQVAFDVVDVLGGFASLVRRSPTLGGSVPVRVAQACVPLLEGNAWGCQLALRDRIELRSRLGRWSVVPSRAADELDRLTRAAVPLLLRDGTLRDGAWRARLDKGALVASGSRVSLFTGLFARPRAGVRLRQSATANRRSWLFTVDEAIFDDADALTPIILDILPAAGTGALVLEGELATLAALPARVAFERIELGASVAAADVAAAHARFYDGEYFATKKRGTVARKYRDRITRMHRDEVTGGSSEAEALVVGIGAGGLASVTPAAPPHYFRSDGPHRAVAAAYDRLVLTNAVALTARFDGLHVTVEPDAADLAAHGLAVRAAWEPWYAAAAPTAPHEGSLLYLTKYITPHPPGEPNFFVKPSALVRTPPGVSTVIDGICRDGYDILRGVVRTDAFHATPAVFHLWRPGATITVPRGAALAYLFPTPRALVDARFTLGTAGAAASWTPT